MLSNNADEDEDEHHEIEGEDEMLQSDGAVDQAKGFLDVWGGVGRPSFDGSEGGDRDSGIEVDRISHPTYKISRASDYGRPPEQEDHAIAAAERESTSLS